MEWISVDERLPDENVYVLINVETSEKVEGSSLNTNNYVACYLSCIGKWACNFMEKHDLKTFDTSQVTHWQPLPEPPAK